MIYRMREVRCKPQGVSYIDSKHHELWSTNSFKVEVIFHTPSLNSAFHFVAMASQTEISKRNSTKICHRVDGRSRYQSAIEKLGSSLPKNWG